MHELALAEAVLEAAAEIARTETLLRVTRLVVALGELQQIDPVAFRSSLERVAAAEEERFRGTSLEVERVPARFRCRVCGHGFDLAGGGEQSERAAAAIHLVPELAHAFLACPACGSPDFDVEEGRGVGISAIEGETPDA